YPDYYMLSSQLTLVAEHTRNVPSSERIYPSEIHGDAVIFDSGLLRIDGHADFLAEPYAGVDVDIALDRIDISHLKPVLSRKNVWITNGALSAKGHVEYGPQTQIVKLEQVDLSGVKLDYVHDPRTAAEEKERVAKVEQAASELRHKTEMVFRVDHLHIAKSNIGFVDRAAKPEYRVFFTDGDLEMRNLSNQDRDGPAT